MYPANLISDSPNLWGKPISFAKKGDDIGALICDYTEQAAKTQLKEEDELS